MDRIIVVNACAGLVDHATAQKWVDAIQRQVADDFAPAWGEAVVLHYAGDGTNDAPGPNDGVLRLVAESSDAGTLGSHWLDGTRPTGEVGVQTCLDEHVAPSSCLSHETLEMLLDPTAAWSAQFGAQMLALEVCDRVEASDDSYVIDGVPVENFSTPAAFIEGTSGPWDFCRKCSSNVVLPNGYQLQVDLRSNQWQQVTGVRARQSKCVAGERSRRAMRMRRAGIDPSTLVLVSA